MFSSLPLVVFFFSFIDYCFHFLQVIFSHHEIGRKCNNHPALCYNGNLDGKGARCVFVFHPPSVWFVFSIIEYCFYFLQVFFGDREMGRKCYIQPTLFFNVNQDGRGTRCVSVFHSPSGWLFFHLLRNVFIFYKSSLATVDGGENSFYTHPSLYFNINQDGRGAR